MNKSLVRQNSQFNFSPLFFLQFRVPPSLFLSLFLFLHWSIMSKLLIQGSSWWWSSFFHGLFPSRWRRLLPLLLCLPQHLHGGKSPLKDLIEAQRSSLHRSSTSKLPSSSDTSFLTQPSLPRFYAFKRSMSTDKSKEDHLRRWNLKWFLSDFCGQKLDLSVDLSLVSRWLLVNSFKEISKKNVWLIILFKDILIILLLFSLFYLTEVMAWTIGWILF